MRTLPALSLSLGAISLTSCGSGNTALNSQQPPGEISIDGTQGEWSSAITTFSDEELWLGVMNDAEHLYVMLVANKEEHIRQIVGLGLTVWIDPKGGEAETFGVRFPTGLAKSGLGMSLRDLQRDPELLASLFEASKGQVEILQGQDTIRVAHTQVEGIEVEAKWDRAFVYELKVPLASSTGMLYGPNIRPGDTIGLGITTPKIDMDTMRQRMAQSGGMGGRGMPAGGGGGMGGGMPSGEGMGGAMGGGRRGMGGMPSLPKPINLWTQVVLAADPRSPAQTQ
jgi:hypothetical protein